MGEMLAAWKALSLAAAFALAAPSFAPPVEAGPARSPRAPLEACANCKDTGEVECKACAKTTCKWEGAGKAQWCTQSVACPECLGTLRAACGKCARGLSEAAKKLHAE